MYSSDLRWRAFTLHYVYNVPCEQIARLFGVSGRTVRRMYDQFKRDGHVQPGQRSSLPSHTKELCEFATEYVQCHPCFFAEELQSALREGLGGAGGPLSPSSILRLLKFELNLSHKVLERRARDAMPAEIDNFAAKMRC